jgi:hypothetical protein
LREAWFGENAKRLIIIRYEVLTREPARVLRRLFEELREVPYAHDFENVVYDEPEIRPREREPIANGCTRVDRACRTHELNHSIGADEISAWMKH